MVSPNKAVHQAIMKAFPKYKDQQVLGPLVWCKECNADYFCLRHDLHYAQCTCLPFLAGSEDDEDDEV